MSTSVVMIHLYQEKMKSERVHLPYWSISIKVPPPPLRLILDTNFRYPLLLWMILLYALRGCFVEDESVFKSPWVIYTLLQDGFPRGWKWSFFKEIGTPLGKHLYKTMKPWIIFLPLLIYLHYDHPQKNIIFMSSTNTVFSFIIYEKYTYL